MSRKAIRRPTRPRSSNSKNRPYQSSASSMSPTSRATWLIPSRRAAIRRRSSAGQPVVVEAQERDHVPDVVVPLDPPSRRSLAPGKHRVMDDPALGVQLGPDRLREREVSGVVTVQVADLAAAE